MQAFSDAKASICHADLDGLGASRLADQDTIDRRMPAGYWNRPAEPFEQSTFANSGPRFIRVSWFWKSRQFMPWSKAINQIKLQTSLPRLRHLPHFLTRRVLAPQRGCLCSRSRRPDGSCVQDNC